MNKKIRGRLTLLLTALIWGIAFVAQSEGMDHLEPFTFNAARTLLGGVTLLPLLPFLNKLSPAGSRSSREEQKKIFHNSLMGGVFCGIVLFAASSFQQCGLAKTSPGKAGFITALYIVLVPVLGVFIRKKIPKITWLCIAVAVVGFWLLCVNENFTVSTGDLLVLCCAIVFSVHIMVVDHFGAKGINSVLMSCIQFFVAGTIMLVIAFIFEEPTWNGLMEGRVSIIYTGVISCGVAYTLQIVGQRDCDPTSATLIMSLESVFAALSSWILPPHTTLSPKELCGCILVFTAVLLAQLPAMTSPSLPQMMSKIKRK